MTTWCQTSSMVSQEAKKLHANTSAGPLRGDMALTAWTTPNTPEDEQGPAHEHSVAGGPWAGETRLRAQ